VSGWLALDRVEVTGTAGCSLPRSSSAAQVRTGTPLARIDTAELEERIAGLAPVADVAVRRDWPAP
jgi:cell division protein FtsQ